MRTLALWLLMAAVTPGCTSPSPLERTFTDELNAIQNEYEIPGVTAAYVLPDGSTRTFAAGVADLEAEAPMSPCSRMLAASIGKMFVGATVLALAQEDRLALDDRAAIWLESRPWFPRLPNNATFTIRQLLTHTSGLPNHVESTEFIEAWREQRATSSDPLDPESLIALVLDTDPLFRPGEGWHYSDTGYLLLGLIIESITGNSWYDEIERRFLIPFGLNQTEPSNQLSLHRLVAGYMASENPFGLPRKTTLKPGVMAWHPGIEGAGGGFVSNPRDLARWAKTLFEGKAITGDYLNDLLHFVPIADGMSYGVSIAMHENGSHGPTYGHGGWIPGYSSSVRYYPDYGVAVSFQINTDIGIIDDSSQVIEETERRLAQVVISSLEKP